MKEMLNIALPKGRLGEKVYGMFKAAGFPCPSIVPNSARLIANTASFKFKNEAIEKILTEMSKLEK